MAKFVLKRSASSKHTKRALLAAGVPSRQVARVAKGSTVEVPNSLNDQQRHQLYKVATRVSR